MDGLQEIVENLESHIADCQIKLNTSQKLVEEYKKTIQVGKKDDIVDYLETKQQMLTAYCVHLSFYAHLKFLGISVASHPVLNKLIELRYAMEKSKPLDTKIKHQLDRLLSQLETNSQVDNAPTSGKSLRPNLTAMRFGDDEPETSKSDKSGKGGKKRLRDNSDADATLAEMEQGASSSGDGLYRAPKLVAMRYENEDRTSGKHQRGSNRSEKLRYSEIMQSMREEFGSAPEAVSSTGMSAVSEAQRKQKVISDERRRFEEDNYRRLPVTRKDKKAARHAERESARFDTVLDIGRAGDLNALAGGSRKGFDDGAGKLDGGKSMRKSLSVFKK